MVRYQTVHYLSLFSRKLLLIFHLLFLYFTSQHITLQSDPLLFTLYRFRRVYPLESQDFERKGWLVGLSNFTSLWSHYIFLIDSFSFRAFEAWIPKLFIRQRNLLQWFNFFCCIEGKNKDIYCKSHDFFYYYSSSSPSIVEL